MANVEIPVTNPHLSASAEMTDNSKTDESIQTSNTTVNVGPGGQLLQHCGNQKGEKEFTRMMSTIVILFISLVCDVILGFAIWFVMTNAQNRILGMMDRRDQQVQKIDERSSKQYEEIKKALDNENEYKIWDLRSKILREIDACIASKKISHSQYTAINDQFDHYRKIGGNHDVKGRLDNLKARILSGEIKMMNDIQMVQDAKK